MADLIRNPEDFRVFIKTHGISSDDLAAGLGISVHTVESIRVGRRWKSDCIGERYYAGVDALVARYNGASEPESEPEPVESRAQAETQGIVYPLGDQERRAAAEPDQSGNLEWVGDTPVNIAVVTRTDGRPLSKHLSVDDDSNLVKGNAGAQVTHGTIESVTTSLRTFADKLLPKVEPHQALVLTNRKFPPGTELSAGVRAGLSRTREHMQYTTGEPALLLLDGDPSVHYRASSAEQFVRDCSQFMPGLEDCARIVAHSTSSWVFRDDGTPVTEAGGLHIYVAIKDPERLRDPEMLKALKDRVMARAWIAGFGEIAISRSGAILTRCCVDTTVWQPERLSYEGAPTLDDGLFQDRPPPSWRDGTFLDLDVLLEPLAWQERQRYEELLAEARNAARPEADRVRAQYEGAEKAKLVAAGLSAYEAAKRVRERLEDGIVRGDDVLHLQRRPDGLSGEPSGNTIPAWWALAFADELEHHYCCDPEEWDYGAAPGTPTPTKARIHRDGIHSWAHGGRRFLVRHTPATLRLHLTLLAETERWNDEWGAVVSNAMLDDVELDRLVDWLPTLAPMRGVQKRNIRGAIKGTPAEHWRRDADGPDLGDAVRDPAELRAEYAEQCAELLDCEDILEQVTAANAGLVINEHNIQRAAYLSAVSPMLGKENLISLAVRGESGVGKLHSMLSALELVPPEAKFILASGSEKMLYHLDEDALIEKVFVMLEANRLTMEDSDLVTAIKSLVADGYIRYALSVKDAVTGDFSTVVKEVRGPTALLTSTTKLWLDSEIETRLLTITADDSKAQTRAVIAAQINETVVQRPEEVFQKWHAFYRWLQLGPRSVCLGDWAKPLVDLVPVRAVRARRDNLRLLAATRTHAFLHQQHRERRADGAVIAGLDDYAAVYKLLEPVFASETSKSTPPGAAEVHAWVKERLDPGRNAKSPIGRLTYLLGAADSAIEVSVRDLAEALECTKSTASRHVHTAIDLGLLENHQTQKKARMWLCLGRVAPTAETALPSPEQLKRAAG